MTQYDYRVLPAPMKGRKSKGVKSPEGRFANAIEMVMNDMSVHGWEFMRAETLPSEERTGLTSSTVNYRTLLVFRRPKASDPEAFAPRLLEAAPRATGTDPVDAVDERAPSEDPQKPQAGHAAGFGSAAMAAPAVDDGAASGGADRTAAAETPKETGHETAHDAKPLFAAPPADNGVEGTAAPDPSLASAVKRRAALIGAAADGDDG